MANSSAIQWTNATWNPTTGCKEISPGCKNCYAKKWSNRMKGMHIKKYKNNFEFTEHISEINLPFKWKKPKKIFVDSMSDLFYEKSTYEFTKLVFDTMLKADWHIYQILTKRPQIMKEFVERYLKELGMTILPNHIWLGTSVESQEYVFRIEILRTIPATIKFISFEPLLGKITPLLSGIHWTIVGGESGHGFRQIKEEWIDSIKKSCDFYKTKFFFKQWGGITSKSGGRIYKEKTWDEMPIIEVKPK